MKDKLKGALKSWTIWFNTSGIILLQAMAAVPELQRYLTDRDMLVVWILINVLLRFKTNSDLAKR